MINKFKPWKWANPYTQDYNASEFWHASLYSPFEQPKKQFILEASSIGDGVEEYAEQIKSLICAAPELYNAAQLFIEIMEISCYEEIPVIKDMFQKIINEINQIKHDK